MQKLSKSVVFLFFVVLFSIYHLSFDIFPAQAQVPELLLKCSETRPNEFHSLRPYQAAPCGGSPQAKFCSNKLVIFENFQLRDHCSKTGCYECDFACNPNYFVEPHNLNITLDESEFPIMGNTQDDFDDAQKLNEYASWYLSGVIDKKENKNPTDSQVIDFSGPVKKLLPKMIQDQQRVNIINSTQTISESSPPPLGSQEVDDDVPVDQPLNHDQIVVDDKRLSFWLGNLSIVRSATNVLNNGVGVAAYLGGVVNSLITGNQNAVDVNFNDAWNLCRPPLPWDDGTIKSIGADVTTDETTVKPKPFESDILYKKAYNEWLGNSCIILPVVGLQCFDNPLVSNQCADLWRFVPLSNNSDKKGKNYLLTGDGPNYVPSNGTEIEDPQHKNYRNAPLYFAHTQEVYDLAQILNQTYQPASFSAIPLPETTEQIKKGTKQRTQLDNRPVGRVNNDNQFLRDPYANLDCSNVNIRVNEGDDLFPGDRNDGRELYVEGAQYLITEVQCHEENKMTFEIDPDTGKKIPRWHRVFTCPAQVGIEFLTGTQTPYANEIFADTVADSGSTFRKIFPKVEKGAPVECIADIPTDTNVTYSIENPLNELPIGGTQDFRQKGYPNDGGGDGIKLTFPHIGSVYEYFLKGIQTALRPKGYGEPIANGNCRPQNNIECGKIPELPKASGACNLDGVSSRVGDIPENLKEIISSAAETYKVQPNLIIGVLFGEGVFNRSDKNGGFLKFDWTEENVTNWASCTPLPNCSGPSTSLVSFVSDSNWQKISEKIGPDLKKLDPNKTNPDPCNLIDVVYGIAWNLYDSADGGMDFKCFGLDLKASIPRDCSWDDNQIISAIKVFENGYEKGCFTKINSCATGGGNAARCIGVNFDGCERIDKRYSSEPSHMGCVFDVAHGN